MSSESNIMKTVAKLFTEQIYMHLKIF